MKLVPSRRWLCVAGAPALVGHDLVRLVANGERALAEVGLDRDDTGALAQPVREDLEAAAVLGDAWQVFGRGGGSVRVAVMEESSHGAVSIRHSRSTAPPAPALATGRIPGVTCRPWTS